MSEYDNKATGNNEPLSELKRIVWQEALDLFEGDEAAARDWMGRSRVFLGNVAPEDMLNSDSDIERLRRFIQQVQQGVVP